MMKSAPDTNAHDATGEQSPVNLPSPAPVASQPTALQTEQTALCQWIARWAQVRLNTRLQRALAATEGNDE